MPNPFAKTRPTATPYAIYQGPNGWEWRVLKTYKQAANEAKNQYSRWFVAAKSPHTWGEFEMGDTYARDVLTCGRLIACTADWLEQQGPRSSVGFAKPTIIE